MKDIKDQIILELKNIDSIQQQRIDNLKASIKLLCAMMSRMCDPDMNDKDRLKYLSIAQRNMED